MRVIGNKLSSAWSTVKQHSPFKKAEKTPNPYVTDQNRNYRHLLDKKIRLENKAKFCKSESIVGAAVACSIVGTPLGIAHLIVCAIGYKYNMHKSKQVTAELRNSAQMRNNDALNKIFEENFSYVRNNLSKVKNKDLADHLWAQTQEAINRSAEGETCAARDMRMIAVNLKSILIKQKNKEEISTQLYGDGPAHLEASDDETLATHENHNRQARTTSVVNLKPDGTYHVSHLENTVLEDSQPRQKTPNTTSPELSYELDDDDSLITSSELTPEERKAHMAEIRDYRRRNSSLNPNIDPNLGPRLTSFDKYDESIIKSDDFVKKPPTRARSHTVHFEVEHRPIDSDEESSPLFKDESFNPNKPKNMLNPKVLSRKLKEVQVDIERSVERSVKTNEE